ncbi:MAG: phenylalanine--tRNA ligase subunit beta, partial [Pseudomonadota bacterium]
PALHAEIDLAPPGPSLLNPISQELSVMRGSLLPGLLSTANYNMARQQSSVRLFEVGHVFRKSTEPNHIGVFMAGDASTEHWAESAREIDFFDLKAELEALLGAIAPDQMPVFKPLTESLALHPGQAAQVMLGAQVVGYIGMLHPALSEARFDGRIGGVFELNIDLAVQRTIPSAESISKYPSVRRDLAILVDESVSADSLLDTVRKSAGRLLHNVFVFDIYRGKGVEAGLKSVALGLILLDSSSTLTDEQTANVVTKVTGELQAVHGAKVRE